MEIQILYEDAAIVVCVKPAGMPVQSDRSLDLDLVNWLKNYRCQKEGIKNPYIGLVHRLDRPVGGVMVFAKTKEAAKSLSRQIQENLTEKRYRCIVAKALPDQLHQPATELTDYLKKDGRSNCSTIVSKADPAGKCAKLQYTVLGVKGDTSLLEVRLLTGRHHQIRVQMAAHVAGLVGDTKYHSEGQALGRGVGIALYSYAIGFTHPVNKKKMHFTHLPEGSLWEGYES
ncbi:MAG: RluA family pseudouridine synthase, partial [Lachnospiraceae bacterium]|nr:RluA family pseudouridine synthase [Lachnospiraceae bacterium]